MADALYEKGFFSVEEISTASVEDLLQVKGVGEGTAEKLIEMATDITSSNDGRASEDSVDKTDQGDDEDPIGQNSEVEGSEQEHLNEERLNESDSGEKDSSSEGSEE